MTLHIRDWARWQAAPIRDKHRGRKKDSRIRRRLAWISVAVEFPEDRGNPAGSFWEFAELVGGRDAETLWIRILQHVGLHDCIHGRLLGVTRTTLCALLVRGYDRPTGRIGERAWDALVKSRLATESCSKSCRKVCNKIRAPEVEVEVEVEVDSKATSKTAVDVAVASDPPTAKSTAVAAPPTEGTAEATPHEAPSCCDDGRLPGGSFCPCPKGNPHRLIYAKCRADERASEKRAAEAGKRGDGSAGGESLAAIVGRVMARARPAEGAA